MRRLRLLLGLIIGALIVQAIVGAIALSRLQASQQHASGTHVALLAHSNSLQADLATIARLDDYLEADGPADRFASADAVDTLFRRIEGTLDAMRSLGSVDASSIDALSASVRAAEREAKKALSIGRRVATDKDYFRTVDRPLERLRERFGLTIVQARAETSKALRAALDLEGAEPPESADPERIEELLERQDGLSSIMGTVDAVVDTALTIASPTGTPVNGESASERVRSMMRTLPETALQLRDEATRDPIVAEIGRLRDFVLADGALLDRARRLAADTADLEETSARLHEEVETVSVRVAKTATEVERTVARLTDGLRAMTRTTLSVLVVIVTLVLLAVLAAGYVVVERQINQRLGKLADEVLRIASGDTESAIEVDGEDEIGDIARALRIFRDNARELRRSNDELEKFAYAAAHDMRSPLRAIESLATWTIEDAGDTLSEDSLDNLETLLARTRRLAQLQTDLLDYAQAGRIDDSLRDTDIGELVDEIRNLADPDGLFEISLEGETRTLRTHRTPLRQILLNLINNAIKHHDRGAGTIVVAVSEERSRLRVAVRDDGPGIEPAYHEQVFGLFTTLQSKDVVEGSGLGLSMVRKLVERYGGQITITSDPERRRGTTFTFDLPVQSRIPATLPRAA